MESPLHDRSTTSCVHTPSGSRVCMLWAFETSCKRFTYCTFDLEQTALTTTTPTSAWRASTSSNNNERLSMPTPRAAALAAGTSLHVKRAHRTQPQRAHSLSDSACPRLRHASGRRLPLAHSDLLDHQSKCAMAFIDIRLIFLSYISLRTSTYARRWQDSDAYVPRSTPL